MAVQFITDSAFTGRPEKAPFGYLTAATLVQDLTASSPDNYKIVIVFQLHYLLPNHGSENTFSTTYTSAKKTNPNKNRTNPAGLFCSSGVWHKPLSLTCLPGRHSSGGWLPLNSLALSCHRFLISPLLFRILIFPLWK